MASLLIQNGTGILQKHELNGGIVTIGRAPDNAIILDDASVSSHHAEAVPAAENWILRDLNSSNGTTLNGRPIVEEALKSGDLIRLGGVECRFETSEIEDQEISEAQAFEGQANPKHSPPPSVSSGHNAPTHTFGTEMAALGRTAKLEAQRRSQMTVLRTRIEKLKLVDLNSAFHSLGEKCFTLQIGQQTFPELFAQLAETEEALTHQRDEDPLGDASISKRAASAIGAKVRRSALGVKKMRLLTSLGTSLAQSTNLDERIQGERNAIDELHSQISALGAELSRVAAAKSGFVGALSHSFAHARTKHTRLFYSCVFAFLAAGLVIAFQSARRSAFAPTTTRAAASPKLDSNGDLAPVTSGLIAPQPIDPHLEVIRILGQANPHNGRSAFFVHLEPRSGEMRLLLGVKQTIGRSEIRFKIGDIDSERDDRRPSYGGETSLVLHTLDDAAVIARRRCNIEDVPTGEPQKVRELGMVFNSEIDARQAQRAFFRLAAAFSRTSKPLNVSALPAVQRVQTLLRKKESVTVEVSNGTLTLTRPIQMGSQLVPLWAIQEHLNELKYSVSLTDLDPERFSWKPSGHQSSVVTLRCRYNKPLIRVHQRTVDNILLVTQNEQDAKDICSAIASLTLRNK